LVVVGLTTAEIWLWRLLPGKNGKIEWELDDEDSSVEELDDDCHR
jgi:hypothetical protein